MTAQILEGDSVDQLRTLADESVHLACTSPPYGSLRTYNGHCDWDFQGTAEQLKRVLVDGGIICWNVGDQIIHGSETLEPFRQAIFFKDALGLLVHDTMFYAKKNFSHPEKTRYHQVVEYIFVLSKGAPRVFKPIKDRKNAMAGCVGNLGVNTFTQRDGSKSVRRKQLTTEYGMRHNLWIGKTRGQEEMCKALPHTAMMPKWLARDLIRSFSNPGDSVLDCFAGSFTTCIQALELGRSCIGIDINPQSIALGRTALTLHTE